MIELVHERGAGGVTVAHVVGRSGVSRRTFYELFEDRDDCLLATFDHTVDRAAGVFLLAYRESAVNGTGPVKWQEQFRAALAALLGFFDQEPAVAGLCVVDALGAGPAVLEHRARVIAALVDELHRRTRAARGSQRGPARIVAEGALGAVLAVIHARLCEPPGGQQPPRRLLGLLNPLMGMIVLPYLGPVAAARELEHPAPRARRRVASAADPLRELDMRLTYRTVRVLLAIAERPGDSSRQVADASGVADQGQISKLLWRLEHLGLIANTIHRGRGEPNAWTLTSKGREVEQAIRTQTSG
jgi:AcrR family transcriptional regulator/DNA-binding MarR family transcriptional regulator